MIPTLQNRIDNKKLNFTLLPGFAAFIKDQKLEQFVIEQIRLSREINLPLLKFFKDLTEEQLIEFSKVTSANLLNYLAQNKAEQLIRESLQQWVADELPQVGRYHIAAEDIPQVSYVRKQSFLAFIPEYTSDPKEMMELVKEIDKYVVEADIAAFQTYINLLDERLNEHLHFIEKIAETTPGIIYVFDLDEHKVIYSNGKTKELLGFLPEDLQNIESSALEFFTQPADMEKALAHLEELKKAKDEEIRYFEQQVKDKNGQYKWIRRYESVFKRDENGKPVQIIGISLDIEKEKQMAEELLNREEQLLEAQEFADMGSFSWNLSNDTYEVTPQLKNILELKDKSELPGFMSRIHPSDRPAVQSAVDIALANGGLYDCEFRFNARENEKVIWSRGIVTLKDGKAHTIKGTIMDVTERHHMIKRLKRSEELYKQAQSLTHLGNWTWDINRNKITWTDEMYRIFGMEPQSEEITFGTLLPFLTPKDKELFLQNLTNLQKSKPEGEYFSRIVLKNGSVKLLSIRAEVLRDENGKPYKILGTVQDVTEQKQNEKRLRENQKFLKKLTDATPSIIAAYNINTGKYLFINQAVEKLLGYKPEQVLEEGTTFFIDKIHPDDMGPLMEKNAQAVEVSNREDAVDNNEIIVDFKYRMRHINGKYHWFQTYGTVFDRNENKKVEHVLNISHDITQQVEAEQKLAEQEHFIQHIAEASPTILFVVDNVKKSIVYINKEVLPVLGFTPAEVLEMGSKVKSILFHPEDQEKIGGMHDGDNKQLVQYECRMREKEKGWRCLLVREISFQQDEDGNQSRVLCAALDISERKEMEHELKQKTFELEQSNSNLEEFAYVASHDLKEPLRKISSFGDRLLAREKETLKEDSRIFLDKIIDSSRRMQKMIDDLLQISMIAGEKTFETQKLDVILKEVLQTLEYKIEEKNAVIKADELPAASIIQSQFRQLFQNLISNSLKFSRPGVLPVITITYKYVTSSEVDKVYLNNASRYLQLSLADNGIGFNDRYSEKIFSIFHRLHGRSEYEGTGIGLAICKKIVENHGGKIYATGVEGEGATFTIIIPA